MGKLILLIALITKHPSIILTMHEAGTQPHKMSLSVTDGIELMELSISSMKEGRTWSFPEKVAMRVSGAANGS